MASLACDTSVLLPSLLSWHHAHTRCAFALAQQEFAVPAHVLMETFSVLTRLPENRLSPEQAAALIAGVDAPLIDLPASEHRRVVAALGARGIGGGATCDALVGATAAHHGMTLLTADLRAPRTYEAVGATYRTV
ncbi:PIN domain-containing protein [Tsukamurella sp. USMM236]|uniref:PIN domain-containing protein n=1 Tax=Tsukamurella sp. USMM236 TaxID=3081301 RepID=UPI00301821B3